MPSLEAKLCKNCGDPIVPIERFTEAGLDYCKKDECIIECGEKINGVAVVGAHKQGPMVITIAEAKGQNFMNVSGHII